MSKKRNPAPVAALRHKFKRTNIPTEELRDFVAIEAVEPETRTLKEVISSH